MQRPRSAEKGENELPVNDAKENQTDSASRGPDRTGGQRFAAQESATSQDLQESLADSNPIISSPSSSNSRPALHESPRPRTPLKQEAASSSELINLVMQRVSLLEQIVKSQAEMIETKGKKISELEEKLKAQIERDRSECWCSRDELEQKCEHLQSQVDEMEEFLGDYGLVWVGKGTDVHSGKPLGINFELILQRIWELNAVAGERECFVQTTATGATLGRKAGVRLRLYRNGLVMADGPFRSYQDKSAQQFVQDIMDGYFPSELQGRFPDGVLFEVQDKRHEDFVDRQTANSFPGKGYRVSGEDGPTDVDKHQGEVYQALDTAQVSRPQPVPSKPNNEAFALSSIAHSQSDRSTILIETPALLAATRRNVRRSPTSPPDTVMLKVRSEGGSPTFLLTMYPSNTVADLRLFLDSHRADMSDYDIISIHPRGRLSDGRRTMRSCGLSTNAVLLLERRAEPPDGPSEVESGDEGKSK